MRAGIMVRAVLFLVLALASVPSASAADAPIGIDDDACVAKSYPGFFAEYRALA